MSRRLSSLVLVAGLGYIGLGSSCFSIGGSGCDYNGTSPAITVTATSPTNGQPTSTPIVTAIGPDGKTKYTSGQNSTPGSSIATVSIYGPPGAYTNVTITTTGYKTIVISGTVGVQEDANQQCGNPAVQAISVQLSAGP